MKILLVDPHILFREGLASMLSMQPDFSIVGEIGTAGEAVKKILENKPDLVLMNINLPDADGLETIPRILQHRPETKILILTEQEDESRFLTAMRRGAKGFLQKNIPVSELIRSIRALERGELAISRTMTRKLVDELQKAGRTNGTHDVSIDVLTIREMEVLKNLGDGCSNGEIADQLSISRNTVRVYIHNILKKLNFRNRREASRFIRSLAHGEPRDHYHNNSNGSTQDL